MLVPIYVDGSPFNAQLQAWGRALDGWWGLLVWPQRVTYQRPVEYGTLRCAAWVPGARLRQFRSTAASTLPKIALPAARQCWPAPPAWDGWYAGAWPDGPLPLPDGVAVDAAPAWRRH